MRRTILFFIFFSLLTFPLFSQTIAVIKEVKGKVEVKATGGSWQPAKAGMGISKGTVISTGFRSRAVLDLTGSTLYVRQITRMKIEELIQKQKSLNTGLYLMVGRVEAKVKTVEGLNHNFKIRSARSIAAVRGTHFLFSNPITVYSGSVAYSNLIGQSVTVGAGESSDTSGYDPPKSGEEGMKAKSEVVPFTSKTGTGATATTPTKTTATVTIELVWP